jgi:hypothetical protein
MLRSFYLKRTISLFELGNLKRYFGNLIPLELSRPVRFLYMLIFYYDRLGISVSASSLTFGTMINRRGLIMISGFAESSPNLGVRAIVIKNNREIASPLSAGSLWKLRLLKV